jgi:hypothetical protein
VASRSSTRGRFGLSQLFSLLSWLDQWAQQRNRQPVGVGAGAFESVSAAHGELESARGQLNLLATRDVREAALRVASTMTSVESVLLADHFEVERYRTASNEARVAVDAFRGPAAPQVGYASFPERMPRHRRR